MKEKATIEFSQHEAKLLIEIVNTAVKVSGLENNIARNAIYFQDKLSNAFKEEADAAK